MFCIEGRGASRVDVVCKAFRDVLDVMVKEDRGVSLERRDRPDLRVLPVERVKVHRVIRVRKENLVAKARRAIRVRKENLVR